MTLNELQAQFPDYAADIKENLTIVLNRNGAPGLTEKEIAAIALAAAMSSSSKELLTAVENFAKDLLSTTELNGVKTAHALMSMTNVYYRFLHVSTNREYKRMPPHLCMKAKGNPGIHKRAYELAALGVSAINNCKACIDHHELSLRRFGVSAEGIQSSVRIAAVIHATAEVFKSMTS